MKIKNIITNRERELIESFDKTDINYSFSSTQNKEGTSKINISFDWDVCEEDQEDQAKLMAITLKRELHHVAPVFLKEFQAQMIMNQEEIRNLLKEKFDNSGYSDTEYVHYEMIINEILGTNIYRNLNKRIK